VGEKMANGASGLPDRIIEVDAAFFHRNENGPGAQYLADGCKSLATRSIAVRFNAVAIDDCN
jgi:hypothetical protein